MSSTVFHAVGAPLPTDPLALVRAQTMCEMMCDAAEASLEVAARVPGADPAGWLVGLGGLGAQ